MTQKKTTKTSVGKVVAIGAGVAAVSVAAYMLFGPNGKKNQKTVKGWAIKMKGEIIEKLELVKDITAPVYEKIVSEVAEKYAKLKHIDAADIEAEVATLRKHWKAMTKPKAKKSVKKITKKVIDKKK